MTADVEAKDVKEGDLVLVPMRVRKIIKQKNGQLTFILYHLEEDNNPLKVLPMGACQIQTYDPEQAVECKL